MPAFYALYKDALRSNMDLHLTEKHRYISPICIDLDLRRPLPQDTAMGGGGGDTLPLPRLYDREHIIAFCRVYLEELAHYVEVPRGTRVYLLEKACASAAQGLLKDGVHIMLPDIVTRPSVQLLVRTRCLERLRGWHVSLGVSNTLEDVFDEAVIAKNNWLMYGSKKPGGVPYTLTAVLDAYSCDAIAGPAVVAAATDLVEVLSLRNKFMEARVHAGRAAEVQAFEAEVDEAQRAAATTRAVMSNTENREAYDAGGDQPKDLDEVRRLVQILSPRRAENYNDWIRLGWCLRNIDFGLLSAWRDFSKQSNKYVEGECDRRWAYMRKGGLGVGTLHMWAKHDNPEQYAGMMSESLRNLVMTSLTGTHHDVAMVIHSMYKHEFVCASIKSKVWYIFKDHRWQLTDSGYILRARISNEVWTEFSNVSMYHQQRSVACDLQVDQQRHQDFAKKLLEVAQRLKNSTFKDHVMKECAELFYVERFEEQLDSNLHLVGFENGVYDLDAREFRDGRPEDYLSFSTKINYVPFNSDDPRMDEIHKYLAQVLTDYSVRDYVLKLFASFLHGAIKDQKFYIWTGSGSNSKSKLVELFEKSFGDYCCKFPITLLTQKRAASNAANSEVARAKGKRFASLQEPSEDEKLNIGLMKELSGGDKIMARSLFKEPIEFVPQFKLLLLCNQLPHVPSDDGGTWRRIRVVEFTSKFVENPRGEHEFPIDIELSKKLEAWKEAFMSLLIEYYRKYVEDGIQEPEVVLKCTTEYKNQNDHVSSFVAETLEPNAESIVAMHDLFGEFRSWVKANGITARVPIKSEMEKVLSKHLGALPITQSGVRGFKGWRFKCYMMDQDQDE